MINIIEILEKRGNESMKKYKLHIDTHLYVTDSSSLTVIRDMSLSNTVDSDEKGIKLALNSLLNSAGLIMKAVREMEV